MQLIEVLDDAFYEVVNRDFSIIPLVNDCLFTEGPVWHPEGYYLFSDTTANCICQLTEDGKKTIWMESSGTSNTDNDDLNPEQAGSNGLAYTREGILICQHGSHAIARRKDDVEILVNSYQGKPLNSPNDLIVHSNGSIYFSDPPYGLKEGKLNTENYQPLAGVYHWEKGRLELISDLLNYPNGVCLSPNENILYICSHKPEEKKILKYSVPEHRYLGVLTEENSDGIEIDPDGNFFLYNSEGVIILNQDGKRLGKIILEAAPSNGCWGGQQGNDMLVTARQYVYLFRDFRKLRT